jgi:hypothetical protein
LLLLLQIVLVHLILEPPLIPLVFEPLSTLFTLFILLFLANALLVVLLISYHQEYLIETGFVVIATSSLFPSSDPFIRDAICR